MPQSRFVTAWEKKTGAKHPIPRHWIGTSLEEPFTTTDPEGATAARSTATPPATNKAADGAAKEK